MGMILRIASSRIVGQGDIVGRSGYFSLNLSANSVMRGRLDARRTLKSLVADLRYIISGYLFFLNVPQGMQSIYKKIYKRGRTLFIPYLIGCLFFVFFNVLIATIPWASKYINSPIMPLFNNSITQIICSIFYDTGNGSPCAFQLWFLRDLILIVATSPLWYLCLKYAKCCFVIITFF